VSRILEDIEVAVPARVAYDQWTKFESFPRFMAGIDRVVHINDRTLEWTATIAGVVKHWRAQITEQEPDQVVSWRSIEGRRNDGRVRFESLGPERTMVKLELDVEPEGFVERATDALGVVERRVRADLLRFRDLVEARGQATGAWRGRIEADRVEDEELDADEGVDEKERERAEVGQSS
jgi:uncharacterized membrane protein